MIKQRRKSHRYELMINTNDNISPLRRRRKSYSGIPSTPTIDQINTNNDDETERESLRSRANSLISSVSSSWQRSFNFETISKMSTSQISNCITECIKLSVDKKINIKNAFNLKIIDYMTCYMARNKDENQLDLQIAATGLDVSAKIYSLRVDSLHQDALRISNSLNQVMNKITNNDKNNNNHTLEDNNNNSENSQTNGTKKAKNKIKSKKKSNNKILTTIKALQGKSDTVDYTPVMFGEIDCQTTNTMYLTSLPQYCNIGLSLNTYYDTIIDTEDNIIDVHQDEPKIKWPPVNKLNYIKNINRDEFSHFQFLKWSIEKDKDEDKFVGQLDQELLLCQDDDNIVLDDNANLPASSSSSEELTLNHSYDYDNTNTIDFYENKVSCHNNNKISCVIADINNFTEETSRKNNIEYSLLDEAIEIRWIGPSYWKIGKLDKNKKRPECRGAQKEKKQKLIIFDDQEIEISQQQIALPKNKNKNLIKWDKLKNFWPEKKLIIPKNSYKNSQELYKFYFRPDCKVSEINIYRVTSLDADDNDNNKEINNYFSNKMDNQNNTSDSYSIEDPIVDASYNSVDDDNPIILETTEISSKNEMSVRPYARRARKLNAFRLKKILWKILTNTDENNNNSYDCTCEYGSIFEEFKNLSEIYLNLLVQLPTTEAEDLSFAVVFTLLLQLVNENNLKIFSEVDNSDIIITSEAQI
ncbi:condensin complex subunit 2-like [Microplitis mediator]|uniref:condensin complex subunit 2-like n=1 Tax=Microplitis mediator TaxID=375433 RepID=UPI0025522190|nr:condensin complex subunit 2-like [Microplitis mediator]XP_057329118.1 condensin complex subunit 2-like [Microplitis mediator]